MMYFTQHIFVTCNRSRRSLFYWGFIIKLFLDASLLLCGKSEIFQSLWFLHALLQPFMYYCSNASLGLCRIKVKITRSRFMMHRCGRTLIRHWWINQCSFMFTMFKCKWWKISAIVKLTDCCYSGSGIIIVS